GILNDRLTENSTQFLHSLTGRRIINTDQPLPSLRVFAIMADGVHQRFVGHDEKYCGFLRCIFMAMKIPERYHEGVALLPLVAFMADGSNAASPPYLVNGGAGVAMAFRLLAATQHLYLAGHGWQRRPASQRIGKIQDDAIVRIPRVFAY